MFIGSSNKEPFEINTIIKNIGEENLINIKIKIYDSVKNSTEETININIDN